MEFTKFHTNALKELLTISNTMCLRMNNTQTKIYECECNMFGSVVRVPEHSRGRGGARPRPPGAAALCDGRTDRRTQEGQVWPDVCPDEWV